MLHSDMGMKINFNVVKQTGQPSCRIVKGGNARQEGSCPQASQFLPAVSIWVERRGKDGGDFHLLGWEDFQETFSCNHVTESPSNVFFRITWSEKNLLVNSGLWSWTLAIISVIKSTSINTEWGDLIGRTYYIITHPLMNARIVTPMPKWDEELPFN